MCPEEKRPEHTTRLHHKSERCGANDQLAVVHKKPTEDQWTGSVQISRVQVIPDVLLHIRLRNPQVLSLHDNDRPHVGSSLLDHTQHNLQKTLQR